MRGRPFTRARTLVAGLGLLLAASTVHAQAWLPAKGEGTASVLYSNTLSKEHFLPDEPYELGHIDANTLLLDVTYGLTDRLTVSFGVPFVTSRYQGNFPHRQLGAPVPLDDGTWHTTSQDLRFGVRYNVLDGPLVVTPFAGSYVPSHDYPFYAHAAPGRALNELAAGVSAGRFFDEPGLVVQGSYAFTWSEEALDTPRRFSIASVEGAYFLSSSLRLMATMSSRIGHTGIDLFPNSGVVLPPEIFQHHDQISRETFVNVGGSVGFSVSDSIDLFGGYTVTVMGRNTHATNRGLSVGMAWGFGRRGAPPTTVVAKREGALIKCLCQKAG